MRYTVLTNFDNYTSDISCNNKGVITLTLTPNNQETKKWPISCITIKEVSTKNWRKKPDNKNPTATIKKEEWNTRKEFLLALFRIDFPTNQPIDDYDTHTRLHTH